MKTSVRSLLDLPKDICFVLSNFIEQTPLGWHTFRQVFKNAKEVCDLKQPIYVGLSFSKWGSVSLHGFSFTPHNPKCSCSSFVYWLNRECQCLFEIIWFKTTYLEINREK